MFSLFRKKALVLPSFVENIEDFPHLKIIKLKGYLDVGTVSEVQHFLQAAKKSKDFLNKSVLLDLRNVARVDSAVVAGLVKVLSALKQKNFKLGLMNVPDGFKGILEILRLQNVFLVFQSEKIAFSEILAWSEDWQ
jgi:anti-anti-sigma factor